MPRLATQIEAADLEVICGNVYYSCPLTITYTVFPGDPPEVNVSDIILNTEDGDEQLPRWLPYEFETALGEQIQLKYMESR